MKQLIKASYSTINFRDSSPKIEVNIIGEDTLFDINYDMVLQVIETIKRYVSGLGFSMGSHLSDNSGGGWSKFMTYRLLIQK